MRNGRGVLAKKASIEPDVGPSFRMHSSAVSLAPSRPLHLPAYSSIPSTVKVANWTYAFGAAAGLMVAGSWIALFWGKVFIFPDTATYFSSSWRVPLGYPLFLGAVFRLTNSLVLVPVLQVILTMMSYFYLSANIARYFRSPVLGLCSLVILLLYTPTLWGAGFAVTEPLYTALGIVAISAAIGLTRSFGPIEAIVLSAATVGLFFLRPAGYFSPIIILYLLILRVFTFGQFIKWLFIPIAALSLATVAINFVERGSGKISQVGLVLFSQLSLHFSHEFHSSDPELAAAVGQALRPFQDRYDDLTGWGDRYRYGMNTYGQRVIQTEAAIRNVLSRRSGTITDELLDRTQRELFFSTLARTPSGFAYTVFEQVFGAWNEAILPWRKTVEGEFQTGREGRENRINLITSNRLPVTVEQTDYLPPGSSDNLLLIALLNWFYAAGRDYAVGTWFVQCVAVGSALAIPAGLLAGKRHKHLVVLGILSVYVHASILLVAATTVFIPRYAEPIEPLILVGCVIAFHGLVAFFTPYAAAPALVLRRGRSSRQVFSNEGWLSSGSYTGVQRFSETR